MPQSAPAETPSSSQPYLTRTVARLAGVIGDPDFPTGERAALKRLTPDLPPPLAFYRFAFRYLPEHWEYRRNAWMTMLAGLALMCPRPHRPDRPLGRALAETNYAEARLERLLAAEGEALHTLVLRAARFLAAKKESVNWTDTAYLLGIEGSSEKARLRIARDYYRNLKDNKKD